MSYIEDLKSKNILIVGGGTTGKSLSNYLNTLGSSFTIFDENSASAQGLDIVTEISDFGIYDLAIVSPGWRLDHLVIQNLHSSGVEVISELDFAWTLKTEINPEQTWLAVTGTNGKTTTIQMLESILIAAGVSGIACGNVGTTVVKLLQTRRSLKFWPLNFLHFRLVGVHFRNIKL